jgi:SPP1 gp7 family putative phage head morphogenesis protein
MTLLPHKHTDSCSCSFNDARRTDPTGTKSIRDKFEADLNARFRRLKGFITRSLVNNDALGIGKMKVVTDSAIIKTFRDDALGAGQFSFVRSNDKVAGFMAWLQERQNEGVLGIQTGVSMQSAANTAWTNTYIESAYSKGIRDAGAKLRASGARVAPSWIESAFTRPIHADRAALAFTRTFTELKGITEAMDQQISRVLANGLAQGKGPMEIAREINGRVDAIGITRARALARTEVVSAHAEATLNSYTEAGVEGVEVEAEFSTSGDNAVCEECDALSGKTFTISESRGIIPVHVNCRCAWNPKVVNGTGIELV